jgi:hypothetical protein
MVATLCGWSSPCDNRAVKMRATVQGSARPEGKPLSHGPIIGLGYCLAGVGVGFGAHAVGGWVSAPIWLLAALLFAAGLWTALVTGGLLFVLKRVEKLVPPDEH